MNYISENGTIKNKSMVEQLKEKNKADIQVLKEPHMPVMVPIQEENWDTMVSLLQSCQEFHTEVYELQKTLVTTTQMQSYMESWSKKQLEKYSEKSLEQDKKLAEVLVEITKLLEEMKTYEQQVGKRIEAITSDTWDKGEELQQAIARASMKTERRAWLKRTAISVTASLLAAVLSTLLCIWLLT